MNTKLIIGQTTDTGADFFDSHARAAIWEINRAKRAFDFGAFFENHAEEISMATEIVGLAVFCVVSVIAVLAVVS